MEGISTVFMAGRPKLQDSLARVAYVLGYTQLVNQVIITTLSKEMLDHLGPHNIAMVFEVVDQEEAARKAARTLLDYEIDTETHLDLELWPMFGRVYCLTSPELDGLVICFRTKTNI